VVTDGDAALGFPAGFAILPILLHLLQLPSLFSTRLPRKQMHTIGVHNPGEFNNNRSSLSSQAHK
jgi:hypothetical protein